MCIRDRYYHINQSINISHLQQTAVTRCQNLQLKCTKFCPSQERHPQGRIYGEWAGRTAAIPSLSPSSRHIVKGKRRKRMCARQENGLDAIAAMAKVELRVIIEIKFV